jgi:hypothetical protein
MTLVSVISVITEIYGGYAVESMPAESSRWGKIAAATRMNVKL